MQQNSFSAACIAVLSLAVSIRADVKPSALFSDHAVLQSGMSVPVWGTADPDERVTVTFNGQTKSATAAADGKWMVRLSSLKPGGPFDMTIAGRNSLTLTDILVGEVWLGSGQSNMEFTVSKKVARFAGLIDEEQEIAAANYPKIRMFTGKSPRSYEPQSTLTGQWLVCSPETVPGFSAVGYLFARDLQKELNVPVGMLTLAFGASTAEAWVRRGALEADPQLKPMIDRFDALESFYREHPDAAVDQAPASPQTINSRPGRPGKLRDPVQDQHQPTVLFNSLINPAIPYAIRGALWYQGESIVSGKAGVALYPHVMETLVTDWRRLWGEGDFPFIAVQLPALQNVSNNPMVREGQAAILSMKNTGLAVTIDIGDPKDVHPHNKEPLGDRLTKIALAKAYGRKTEYSGPVFQSIKVEAGAIRVKFSHAAGLTAKGGPLKWFQVAGEDQKFVDAEARIDGGSVIVSSPLVPAPAVVRYAWDNYPDTANLYNSAGLPAGPFRTDQWDALTAIADRFTANKSCISVDSRQIERRTVRSNKTMQYLLLIYEDETRFAKGFDESEFAEYGAFGTTHAGAIKGGNALQPTGTAKTVRVRAGKTVTTDGPFAETKEQLGGYYLIEAATIDEAASIAAGIPAGRYGGIEIRPVMVFS